MRWKGTRGRNFEKTRGKAGAALKTPSSLIHSIIKLVSDPFSQLTLQSPGASGVRIGSFNHKTNNVAQDQSIINPLVKNLR